MKPSVQKYRLTNRTKWHHSGRTLYQIQALKSFGDVKAGDFGGWVESYDNLSQFNNCWIYKNAKVFGDARVYDNAVVKGNATVSENARIYDFAQVYGSANIYGKARIYNRAQVYGHSKVYGSAKIEMFAQVYHFAQIHGKATISSTSKIYDDAEIYDSAYISGDIEIYGKTKVYENARIFNQAKIYGYNTRISGNTYIYNKDTSCDNDVIIASTRDYLVLHTNWADKDYVTYTRSNNMYKAYDFYGSAEELLKKAYKESQWKGDCYKNMVESVERLYAIFDKAEKQRGFICDTTNRILRTH